MGEKNPRGYIPLHVHSEYSALDGTIRIKPYVEWCGKNGVMAASVTDHGMMAGCIDLHRETTSANITPIFGCELYSQSLINPVEETSNFHLLALARNRTGYLNLMKIISMAHVDGFNRKPRVNLEILSNYAEGIIFSTACVQGELSQYLLRGDMEKAKKFMEILGSFSRDTYVELIDVGNIGVAPKGERLSGMTQYVLNEKLNDFATNFGYRTVMTTDAHYFAQDRSWHPQLMKAQMTKGDGEETSIKQEYLDHLKSCDLTLKTPEQMWERWGNKYPEALLNTVEIAESVERFPIGSPKYLMPKIDLPGRRTSLRETAKQGLETRLDHLGVTGNGRHEYEDRLEYELGVVEKMGFSDYFDMVSSIVADARSKGIAVGPGRGSAAGSLLAYATNITQVDPIRYGLLFERFLNPERISMPDIDIDIEDVRRGEVIDYLKTAYGADSVIGIATYSRPKWRSALRDASRVLGFPVGPGNCGDMFVKSLEAFLPNEEVENVDLNALVQDSLGMYPNTTSGKGITQEERKEVLALAQNFKGIIRHYGAHACGIVIAPPNVREWMPLCRVGGKNGDIVSQYDMSGVDYLKLIKMDILGLSTLTDIKNTVERAKEYDPNTPDIEDIFDVLNAKGHEDLASAQSKRVAPETLERTAKLLADADTTGVFQLMSPGMRRLLRQIRPSNIQDLSALVALYRPGPIGGGIMKAYMELSQPDSGNDVDNPFPESMRSVIGSLAEDSKGLIIYQEQVMKAAREIAGYSLGQADLLRRAMGKKKLEVMQAERERFVKGAVERGFDADDASTTFGVLEHFAGYGFNKSHSTAYAFLAYITAWYKACRKPAFLASLLENKYAHERMEDIVPYTREVNQSIRVIPPVVLNDKTLGNLVKIKLIKPKKTLTISAETAWKSGKLWLIRLGLECINKMASKKLEKFLDFPAPKRIQDLFMTLIDPRFEECPPATIAKFLLCGVFDAALRNEIGGRNQKHLRGLLLMLNEPGFIESNSEITKAIDRICEPLRTTRSASALERIRKENRDFTTGLFSYVVGALRKKRVLKKRPWEPEWFEDYRRDHLECGLDKLFSALSVYLQRVDMESEFHLRTMSLLSQHERTEYGDSTSMPSWKLASDIIGRGFTCYADELRELGFRVKGTLKSGTGKKNDGISKEAELASALTGNGIWVLGYPGNIFSRMSGEEELKSFILSGRYGDSKGTTFISITSESEKFLDDITISKGQPCAFLLSADTKSMRFTLRDFRKIPMTYIPSNIPPEMIEGTPLVGRLNDSMEMELPSTGFDVLRIDTEDDGKGGVIDKIPEWISDRYSKTEKRYDILQTPGTLAANTQIVWRELNYTPEILRANER